MEEKDLSTQFYYEVIDTNSRKLKGAIMIQQMFGFPNEYLLVYNESYDFFLIGPNESIVIRFLNSETEEEILDEMTETVKFKSKTDEYVTIRLKRIKFYIDSLLV